MKSKALLTAVLLTATNLAWAQGGLSIDNADANGYVSNHSDRAEIVVQGPIDKFAVEARPVLVDTEKFKNSNNGQV